MFARPVDPSFPITAEYGQEGPQYENSLDPDNGLWLPVQNKGLGNNCGTVFDCPPGTPVRAMANGFIVRASHESALDHQQGAGLRILQLVSLPGFDSWILRYSHLQNVFVHPGQQVTKHDTIAQTAERGLTIDLMNLRYQYKPINLDT